MFTVTTSLTLDGSVETFDKGAFRMSFAVVSKVEASAVSVTASSGSIIVTATVTTLDASSAASVAQRISTVVTSPTVASDALGVVVVSIDQAPVVASVTLSAEELQQLQGAGSSSATPAIIGGVVGGVVVFAALVLCRFRCSKLSSKQVTRACFGRGIQPEPLSLHTRPASWSPQAPAPPYPWQEEPSPTTAAISKTGKAPPSKHIEIGVNVDNTPSTADQVPSLPPSPPSSRKGSARVAPRVV